MPQATAADTVRTNLEAGRVHAAVDAAWPRVLAAARAEPAHRDPDDAALLLPLLKGLATLRLGAAARRILDLTAQLLPGDIDPVGLAADLASIPTGRLSWDAFARTARENAAALERHRPEVLRAIGDPAEQVADLELHRDVTGGMHLLDLSDEPAWLGGLVDHRAEATFETPRENGRPIPIQILGLTTGRLLDRTWETSVPPTGDMPRPIHLLETEPRLAAAWLHLGDHRELLADPRVVMMIGPDAVEAWGREMRRRPGVATPERAIHARTGITFTEPAAIMRQEIRDFRGAEIERGIADLTELWRAVDDVAAAARLAPGTTIAGFTSRFTTVLRFAMRDVAHAFEAMGYRFVLVEEDGPGEHLAAERILRTLVDERVDLVITFNRLRPDGLPMFGQVPVLTFVLDPVDEVLSHEGAARAGQRDVLAGFYRDRAVNELGYRDSHYRALPFFPVSTRTFHDAALSPTERERFSGDVVFIGNARGDADAWHQFCLGRFPGSFEPLFDAARAELDRRVAAGTFIDQPEARRIVDAAAGHAGLEVPDRIAGHVASMYVHRMFDIRWRLDALTWVAAWADESGRRLNLFGDGWDRLPAFSRFARGPVDHDTEARLAYRGSPIALQLIPSGLVHQRTFEAIACGTLVVARETPQDFDWGTREAFRAAHGDGAEFGGFLCARGFRDLDRIVFDGPEDTARVLDTWTHDVEARAARVERERAIVARSITWSAVLPNLLEDARRAIAGTD